MNSFFLSLRFFLCLLIIRCLVPQQQKILPLGLMREIEKLAIFETCGQMERFITFFSWVLIGLFFLTSFLLSGS